jgi:hypothetical protein
LTVVAAAVVRACVCSVGCTSDVEGEREEKRTRRCAEKRRKEEEERRGIKKREKMKMKNEE